MMEPKAAAMAAMTRIALLIALGARHQTSRQFDPYKSSPEEYRAPRSRAYYRDKAMAPSGQVKR